jgi:uncharacterized protein YkvS
MEDSSTIGIKINNLRAAISVWSTIILEHRACKIATPVSRSKPRKVHHNHLPRINVLSFESSNSLIFSGLKTSVETATEFSRWLRKVNDAIRMNSSLVTNEQKANFLIAHLDGAARETIEQLDEVARLDFDAIVKHLQAIYESPQQRFLARQALWPCKQEIGESASNFGSRILDMVRAATSDLEVSAQRERALEEFITRLRPELRFHVKMENPSTFESAVDKAQTVEYLLLDAQEDQGRRKSIACRWLQSKKPRHLTEPKQLETWLFRTMANLLSKSESVITAEDVVMKLPHVVSRVQFDQGEFSKIRKLKQNCSVIVDKMSCLLKSFRDNNVFGLKKCVKNQPSKAAKRRFLLCNY